MGFSLSKFIQDDRHSIGFERNWILSSECIQDELLIIVIIRISIWRLGFAVDNEFLVPYEFLLMNVKAASAPLCDH